MTFNEKPSTQKQINVQLAIAQELLLRQHPKTVITRTADMAVAISLERNAAPA